MPDVKNLRGFWGDFFEPSALKVSFSVYDLHTAAQKTGN